MSFALLGLAALGTKEGREIVGSAAQGIGRSLVGAGRALSGGGRCCDLPNSLAHFPRKPLPPMERGAKRPGHMPPPPPQNQEITEANNYGQVNNEETNDNSVTLVNNGVINIGQSGGVSENNPFVSNCGNSEDDGSNNLILEFLKRILPGGMNPMNSYAKAF